MRPVHGILAETFYSKYFAALIRYRAAPGGAKGDEVTCGHGIVHAMPCFVNYNSVLWPKKDEFGFVQ